MQGYRNLQIIYQSQRVIVSRAVRELDGKSVVLKALNSEFPGIHDLTRIKYEYELSGRAKTTGTVPIIDLVKHGNGFLLVMEDVGGIPLLEYWNSTPKTLAIFLNLAVQIAQILSSLHEKEILHKDIKPANLLVQKETGKVYIIDLGLASLLQSEEQAPVPPETLEGTLSYISPEQTGRMNRSIDFRSDLYSLGITFYELLTGRLPFTGTDPLELVHAHIAVSPKPPVEINGDIPKAISDLILKLLSKNAEDRYLSAKGLMEDLELARELLFNEKPIEFLPGERESKEIFFIPQKLYGREAEVSYLLDAFDQIASSKERVPEDSDTEGFGGTKLVLVGGYSGVGKTALINEVHKPILEKRGYFLSGKFDQFKRNIPYYSLIQAFTDLVRQILSEKEEKIGRWKEKILEACSPNVNLLMDLIPDLIHITGEQPLVGELPPREAEERFEKTLQDFVSVFASLEHPLVLFLDDLQWADLPTLKFLETIVLNNEIQHLLLIGAYRDNEVDALHPLTLMMQAIEKESIPVLKIILAPLMVFFIERMISDTFQRDVGSELPELVYKKTGGNPFFVRQFLTTLYRDRYLYYSPDKKWEFDLDAISNAGYSENIVDIVANRLKELSLETQEVLKVASCIGDRFELSILCKVLQKAPKDTVKLLQEAGREGTILPMNETYKTAETLDTENISVLQSVVFKFIHDRVQQAANSLLSEEEKMSNHLRIGKSLMEGMEKEKIQENIFEIVNHLNYGLDSLESLEEKSQLLELNYRAGQRAVESFSYESAVKYFENSISLIQGNTPQEIRFQCKYEHYNSMYKSGRVDEVRDNLDSVFDECSSKYERALLYNLKVICQTNLGEYENSVKTCIEALKLFGIELKENITGKDIFVYYKALSIKLKDKRISDLYNLPKLENIEIKVIMEILMSTIASAYWKIPSYSIILIIIMVEMSIDFGLSYSSSLSFAFYGSFLVSIGLYKEGYEYGQLSLSLYEKNNNELIIFKIYNALGVFINNWIQHSNFSINLLINNFDKYIYNKDFIYGSSIVMNSIQILYIINTKIDNIYINNYKYIYYLKKNKSYDFFYSCSYIFTYIQILSGNNPVWINIMNTQISEDQYISNLENCEFKIGLYYFYVSKMHLEFILYNYKVSFIVYSKLKPLRVYGVGVLNSAQDLFVTSLLLLKLNLKDPEDPEVDFTKELESNLKQYKKWSEINPANFKHKYNLILAEYARFKKEFWDANLCYDIALESAIENEYNLDAGLCAELAGEFYLEQNRIQQAKKYFQTSLYYYNLCGAKAKVNHVRSLYPEYTSNEIDPIEKQTIQSTTILHRSAPTSKHSSLDIQTILKANRAISEEINLDSLLKKLLSILLENAGATRGILLLYEGDTLCIEAEAKKDNETVNIYNHYSLENYTEIPKNVIQYVSKTSEIILLDSTLEDLQFGNNPYLQREKIQSLLCIPISAKGKNIGLLYLENSLIRRAFTKNRIEPLNMIVSQGAVSIENAKLYSKLTKTNLELELQSQSLENLNSFVRGLNESMELSNLLRKISRFIEDKYGIEHIALSLIDNSGNYAYISEFTTDVDESIKKIILSIKIPLTNVVGAHAYSFLSGKPLYTINIKTNRIAKEEKEVIEILNLKTFIILPLDLNGKRIGFLDLGNIHNTVKFTKEQISEISILSKQLAGIIYNSNLKQELQLQKNELELTNERATKAYLELEASQKQLVRSDKMITLGTMVAGVAHEINTPLGAIKANSENISEQMKSLLESLNPENQNLSLSELQMVIRILELTGNSSTTLSSKEQRALRKKIVLELESKGIIHPEEVAEKMIEMGLVSILEGDHEIYKVPEFNKLLGIASLFFGIQKKSGVIQTSAERVSKIVKSLKSFMHFDQSDEKKLADITEGMETVLTILHNKIKYGIEVIKNYETIPQILCFTDELNQIWTNLIHNAIQAMKENGSLQIDIEKVSSAESKPDIDKRNSSYSGDYISVSIQDSGPGIPPEIREKIFQAFFTTKPAGEGSGLGLHIIGKILEKHEGALYLESQPGRTRFSVILPIGETV